MSVLQRKNKSDFDGIFWTHIVLLFFAYFSPFLFSIKYIAIIYILVWAHWQILGDCYLTYIAFNKDREPGEIQFYRYYLSKLGINLSREKTNLIARKIIPVAIFLLAIWWQLVLNNPVYFF